MYQTVGQDAVELVAQALDVPLFRRVIKGSAVEQGSEYGSRGGVGLSSVAGDETEDMYELLNAVIVRYWLYEIDYNGCVPKSSILPSLLSDYIP